MAPCSVRIPYSTLYNAERLAITCRAVGNVGGENLRVVTGPDVVYNRLLIKIAFIIRVTAT
jgi:hypothetical protein